MIDKQKLIDDLKKQIESNDNYIEQLKREFGSNYILLQNEYGSLIANINGKSAMCIALIKRIASGCYNTKEDEQ